MPVCLSQGEPIIYRRMCADENEVGECFFCDRFIHQGDCYTLVVVRKDGNEDHEDNAFGICEVCSNVIATCANLGRMKH